jgi:chromosome segregation ATPase
MAENATISNTQHRNATLESLDKFWTEKSSQHALEQKDNDLFRSQTTSIEKLTDAIEGNHTAEALKAAKDIFFGSPTNTERMLEIHNQAVQGIGNVSSAFAYNKASHANIKKAKKDAARTFLSSLNFVKQINDIINKAIDTIKTNISTLEREQAYIERQIEDVETALSDHETQHTLKTIELDTVKKEIDDLGKDRVEIKELTEEKTALEKEQEILREIQALPDRHEYMKSKYYLLWNSGEQENIRDVSNDPSRIVTHNGHTIKYDTDSMQLFYLDKDQKRVDIPNDIAADIWRKSYDQKQIFAQERAVVENAMSFISTYTSEELQTAKIKILINIIDRKVEQEISDTGKAIREAKRAIPELNKQLKELEVKESKLIAQQSALGDNKDELQARLDDLEDERNRIQKELITQHKDLFALTQWQNTLKNPQASQDLYDAIHNDDTRTVTEDELNTLTKGLTEDEREKIIEILREQDVKVEEPKQSAQTNISNQSKLQESFGTNAYKANTSNTELGNSFIAAKETRSQGILSIIDNAPHTTKNDENRDNVTPITPSPLDKIA